MKLVVNLAGGLGNQMFQYATARSIAEKNGAELVLDAWSGFVRDRMYRRSFELGKMPIAGRVATRAEVVPFLIDRLERKLGRQQKGVMDNRWYGNFLTEPGERVYLPEVDHCVLPGDTYMKGAWQTDRYFSAIRTDLFRELSPAEPTGSKWHNLAAELLRPNSVAIGVRLYEEVPGASKAGVGGLTSLSALADAAGELSEGRSDLRFFIFCTRRTAELNNVRLPGLITFVTHDDGFEGTHERLWLLSLCHHHIISNSSFYWWGAWLSEQRAAHSQQVILASDRFLNNASIPERWVPIR